MAPVHLMLPYCTYMRDSFNYTEVIYPPSDYRVNMYSIIRIMNSPLTFSSAHLTA